MGGAHWELGSYAGKTGQKVLGTRAIEGGHDSAEPD